MRRLWRFVKEDWWRAAFLAVVIVVGGERIYHTYSWIAKVNWYLVQPVAKGQGGEVITRAQALDLLVKQALSKPPGGSAQP